MLSYFSFKIWIAASLREFVSLFGGILTTSLMCTMANIILYASLCGTSIYELLDYGLSKIFYLQPRCLGCTNTRADGRKTLFLRSFPGMKQAAYCRKHRGYIGLPCTTNRLAL